MATQPKPPTRSREGCLGKHQTDPSACAQMRSSLRAVCQWRAPGQSNGPFADGPPSVVV